MAEIERINVPEQKLYNFKGQQFFTKEEMDEICELPKNGLVRCMKEGNKEKAREFADRIFVIYKGQFQCRIDWSRRLNDFVYENVGVEGIVAIMQNRGFTDAELNKLLIDQSDMDRLYAMIDSGDVEGVEKWADIEYRRYIHAHNAQIEWETRTMSWIYNNMGADRLYEVMELVVADYFDPMAQLTTSPDLKAKVKVLVDALHWHGQPCRMEETDDTITAWMCYCGSGTHLLEMGIYEGPTNAVLCKACHNTWEIDNFPIYCTHAIQQEKYAIRRYGFPLFVNCPLPEERNQPGYQFAAQSCAYIFYKDPRDTPEYVYERLGMEKPAWLKK